LAYACIDVGSNTTRLLVAEVREVRLSEVAVRREFTRIGRSLIGEGRLPEEKIGELCGIIAAQAELARELGATSIAVVGTAAIRHARNRDELAKAIRGRCGLGLRVLSGSEEAELSFAGATRCRGRPPGGRLAVIDAGGWSTEVVLGTYADGVAWSESFPIGSGLLADRHLRSDPPAPGELAAVRDEVRQAFADIELDGAQQAAAVGGSATSLRRLVGSELEPDALERAIGILRRTPIAEAAHRLELHEERVRLMPAAMMILADLSQRLGLPLEVAGGGLREGLILELADQRRR
jgi:exopolyphosphatase / guanosine-5'-triphosphate,3'-diphosphate pyrophosphatase